MTTKPSDMFGRVKERKIVFVRATADTTGTFTYDMHVNFPVDEMQVIYWVCGESDAPNVELIFLKMSTLRELNYEGTLTILREQDHASHRVVFDMKGIRISGPQTFNMESVAGATLMDRECDMGVCLEFLSFYK